MARLIVAAGAQALHESAVEQRPRRGDAAVDPAEMVEVELVVRGESLEWSEERLRIELRVPLGVAQRSLDVEAGEDIGADLGGERCGMAAVTLAAEARL